MTTLEFVAAGLQFWTIIYMQEVINVDAIEAQSLYLLTIFSAVIPGVIFGSITADYYGGYKGRGMINALTLCCIFGFFGATSSLLLSITFEKTRFTIFLWFFFFFGGCLMPIGAGIIVDSVPKYAQNSA